MDLEKALYCVVNPTSYSGWYAPITSFLSYHSSLLLPSPLSSPLPSPLLTSPHLSHLPFTSTLLTVVCRVLVGYTSDKSVKLQGYGSGTRREKRRGEEGKGRGEGGEREGRGRGEGGEREGRGRGEGGEREGRGEGGEREGSVS